jgi:predicted nucleic acid-binding protein
MGATLVDANILIDSFDPRSPWKAWADEQLVAALQDGALFVNQIVYAELSVGFRTPEECDRAIDNGWLERVPLPWPAAFIAGRAFREYRRRGGTRRSPLPDFFIGAHAAVEGLRLLTRDARRYRAYFPTVELIAPEPGDPPG